MHIGSLKLSGNLFLAPMVRVTDPAFRVLCREQGASLAFTEMIVAEALARKIPKIVADTRAHEKDRPLGVQIAATDPKTAALAIQNADESAALFDLNLGCPVHRAQKQGIGAALLSKPVRIGELMAAMRSATDKPITAKIRVPHQASQALKIAKILEQNGADAITVHARNPSQGNSSEVNLQAVRQVHQIVSIPVIHNGGVRDNASLETVFEKTACEAVMIASAAIGNPGIFAELQGRNGLTSNEGLKQYLANCKKLNYNHFGRIKQQALRFCHAAGALELHQQIEKARTLNQIELLVKGS